MIRNGAVFVFLLALMLAVVAKTAISRSLVYQGMPLHLPQAYKGIEVNNMSKAPFMVIKLSEKDRENMIMLTLEDATISAEEVKAGCHYRDMLEDAYEGTDQSKTKCKPERVALIHKWTVKDKDHLSWKASGYSFYYYAESSFIVLYVISPEGHTIKVVTDSLSLDELKSLIAFKDTLSN